MHAPAGMCTGASGGHEPGCARAGGRRRYRGRVTAAPQAESRADSRPPSTRPSPAGSAAEPPVTWCWTWGSSPPASCSPPPAPPARTRCCRCGCGCARGAGSRSWSGPTTSPRSRWASSRRRWPRQRAAALRAPGRGRRAARARHRRRVPEPARRHLAARTRRARAHRGGARRRRGRRRRRLLRADALPGPARRARRTRRAARARRDPAAAVPLPRRDRRRPAVERPAPRPLRVLLDAGDGRHARRGRAHRHHRPPVPALRRHGPPGRDSRRPADGRPRRGRRRRGGHGRARPGRGVGAAGLRRPHGRVAARDLRRRAAPPGVGCTATAPPRAPWPCCGSPGSTRACSPPSPTPHRTSTAAACPAPTSRSSRRTRWSRRRPDVVLLFVSDLAAEVRAALPQIEAAGGRWVDAGAGR